MISDSQLKRWRELADAATAGPWEAPVHPESVVDVWTKVSLESVRAEDVRRFGRATGDGVSADFGNRIVPETRGPDATFIAAAREAVPALLDEVERLRAMLKNHDQTIDQLKTQIVRHSCEEYLDRMSAIVRDLAEHEPVTGFYDEDESSRGMCLLCGRFADGRPREQHAESCPWRRAREAVKP